MTIDRLKRIQSAPGRPIDNQGNWENVADLGGGITGFPIGYKEIIESYGTFAFGDFIWVLNPFTDNPNIQLANQMRVRRDALTSLKQEFSEAIPYRIENLVPWFITDNGDVGYWVAAGDCDTWRTAVNATRDAEWFKASSNSVEFLCDVLTKTITVPFFPEDFPLITA